MSFYHSAGVSALNKALIPKRFFKTYVDIRSSVVSDDNVVSDVSNRQSDEAILSQSSIDVVQRTPSKPKKNLTEAQRYNLAHRITNDIANRVSLTGGAQFSSRIEELKKILNYWDSGREVVVLPIRPNGVIEFGE